MNFKYQQYIKLGLISYIKYDEYIKIHSRLIYTFYIRYDDDSLSSINEYINDYFETNISVTYDIYSFYLYIRDFMFILYNFETVNYIRKEILYDNLSRLAIQIRKYEIVLG